MPQTQSSEKALRQAVRRRKFNWRVLTIMRSQIKTLRRLLEQQKVKEAQALLPQVYKAIDKAAKRGVIKKNNAARKKSRLALLLQKQ